MQHIADDGRGEGGAFTDLLGDLARRNPGIHGYAADGALRGTHIGRIQAATGCAVVSPPRRKTKKGGGITIDKYGFAAKALPPSRTRAAWLGECGGHDLWALGGTLFERVVTSDGSPDFPEVPRGQVKRQRNRDGTYAYYARFRLPCPRTGTTHSWWEPLTPTQGDARHGFNRSEYLRVLPENDDDYARVYGMRADTESLNATLEQAFHKQRLPAWGLHNQTVVVLMAVIAQNSWARHVWNRELDRQHPPPDRAAA